MDGTLDIPDAAPTGQRRRVFPAVSHGWLAVGYRTSPLPWLKI